MKKIWTGSIVRTKAVAKRGVCYEWYMSVDGGKTWTLIAITTDAFVRVQNLAPGTTYVFHYRTWQKAVASTWSQDLEYMHH